MRQMPCHELDDGVQFESKGCSGIVKRDGYTTVVIDGCTWLVCAWKCDRCGRQVWSYFDDDLGPREGQNESFNMDQGPDCDDDEEDYWEGES